MKVPFYPKLFIRIYSHFIILLIHAW